MVEAKPREVVVSVGEEREMLAEEEGMCPGSPRVPLQYSGWTQSWGHPGKGGYRDLRSDQ